MNAPAHDSPDITQLLRQWRGGKSEALDTLMPLVYEELRRQAANYLRRERPDHTLQTTALINEAFLRLIDQRDVDWQSRAHFFGISAQLMRRILVDYARTKYRQKRGGHSRKVSLDDAPPTLAASDNHTIDLLALDEALDRLQNIDEQQSRIVELRYFSGLSTEDTALVLGVSTRTVERGWTIARAWLYRELDK